jgi:hypothetical protein
LYDFWLWRKFLTDVISEWKNYTFKEKKMMQELSENNKMLPTYTPIYIWIIKDEKKN